MKVSPLNQTFFLRERPSRSRPSLLKEKKDYWRSRVKRTSTQTRALDLDDQLSSQDLLFQPKKKLKISGEENKHTKHALNPERSNFQVKTFSFNQKETSDSPKREENKYPNCVLDPEDQTYKSKIKTFMSETNLLRRRLN